MIWGQVQNSLKLIQKNQLISLICQSSVLTEIWTPHINYNSGTFGRLRHKYSFPQYLLNDNWYHCKNNSHNISLYCLLIQCVRLLKRSAYLNLRKCNITFILKDYCSMLNIHWFVLLWKLIIWGPFFWRYLGIWLFWKIITYLLFCSFEESPCKIHFVTV